MKDSIIAYFGVPGSFSHVMAVRHFGKDNTFVGTRRLDDICVLMEQREAQYGVVPLENNWAGPIRENFDLILNHRVFLIADEYLEAVHNLVGVRVKGQSLEERVRAVRKVISHPKTLELCRPFLEQHPLMEPTIVSDTGRAAQYVSDLGDPAVAAIASTEAARIYTLDVLSPNIQASGNVSRFGFLGVEPASGIEPNKASIIVTVLNKPGQMLKVLQILADHDCNVSWVEQRTVANEKDDCVIFLDFEFPENKQLDAENLFEQVRRDSKTLRIVGVYRSNRVEPLH